MRYALVDKNDVVVNVIELEPDAKYAPEAGLTLVAGRDWPAPPAPPALPPPVPTQISDRQFFQALAMNKAITEAEALEAVKTGAIPSSLQTFVDTMPADSKFSAEMMISGAVTFDRSHPMTAALAAGMGWTSAQVDDLWRVASTL